jgi:hypothetical protein
MSARRARPYAEESSDKATVSPRSSIHTARSGASPERISIFASGSVYGPDVSYTTSGGFFSKPKEAGVSLCAISRIGTRMSAREPST